MPVAQGQPDGEQPEAAGDVAVVENDVIEEEKKKEELAGEIDIDAEADQALAAI